MSAVLFVSFILFNGKFSKENLELGMDEWKFWGPLLFFALLSLWAFNSLKKAIEGRPTAFANQFMVVTIAKLLGSVLVFGSILYFGGAQGRLFFTACFILQYLIFTIFLTYNVNRLKSKTG